MRTEIINGNKCVCGHIFPTRELTIGSKWQTADGSKLIVTIISIEDDEVTYEATSEMFAWSKDAFSFQCRYCLILE